eukprot:6104114-Prymnesium_polylepis.1
MSGLSGPARSGVGSAAHSAALGGGCACCCSTRAAVRTQPPRSVRETSSSTAHAAHARSSRKMSS